jgi:hypothetical protein
MEKHDMNHAAGGPIVRQQPTGAWESWLLQALKAPGRVHDDQRGYLKRSLQEAIETLVAFPRSDDQDGQQLVTAKDQLSSMFSRIVELASKVSPAAEGNVANVYPGTFRKVASALLHDNIPASEAANALADLVQTAKSAKGFTKGAGQYFNWSFGELFKRHGLQWTQKPAEEPTQEDPDPWDDEPSESQARISQ